MRPILLAASLVLVACLGPSSPDAPPPPDVPVVLRWPAGTRFTATVAPGLPDEPRWRALAGWWREALRQTTQFGCGDGPPGLPRLELSVDPAAESLTVSLRDGGERLLTGASFRDADLLAAIDRAAWEARLALGEDAPQPVPVAMLTSRDPQVVLAVDDAAELAATGAIRSARRTLLEARKRDGGAPHVLEPLAALELLRGDADQAQRICTEALGYARRCSPTTQHRLGRTLLMAKAARQQEETPAIDRELLRLAQVGLGERPHDDEPLWSLALAHNFRAEFAAARPLLERLLPRLPDNGFVAYHLGWACLATGAPEEAAQHLATAGSRLPGPWVLLPRAIALYESGQHDALRRLLDDSIDDASGSDDVLYHQVLRMQAAHAVLLGDLTAARHRLVDDLRWLAKHPLALEQRVGEFAEMGALLVRLGGADELSTLLATIQRQHPVDPVADACAFVGGMQQVATTGEPVAKVVTALSHAGDSAFASRLLAFAHERRGEVGDMQTELARAARLSSSPMTKALLAKSLRAVGKADEAELLHRTLRSELETLHLRRACQHPLYGPELAYAYILR